MSPTILVDGVRRPTTNSRGRRIAGTDEKIRNFWRWFRDSAAREPMLSSKDKWDTKRPLVLYHGTKQGFDAFRAKGTGTVSHTFGSYTTQRHGIFLAESPSFASTFAVQGEDARGGRVMAVYLRAENPLYLTSGLSEKEEGRLRDAGINIRWLNNLREPWEAFDGDDGGLFVSALIKVGYDGVVMSEESPESGEREDVWVVFSPTQIKSATGNRGTFDPGDPVITNPGRVLQAEIPRIPDDYAVQAKLAALTDDELLTDKHFRLQDAQDEIRDRAIATIMAEQPFDGLVIPLREHTGTFAIVAPFVKQRGVKAWQATNFDARGPWTDTVASTIPELLRDIYLHYKADFHKTKVVRKR